MPELKFANQKDADIRKTTVQAKQLLSSNKLTW